MTTSTQRIRIFGLPGEAVVAALIVVVTAIAYWSVRQHAFIAWDDNVYVYENKHVLGGLTGDSIGWALTSGHAANWHPLTWISHMIDVEIHGPTPEQVAQGFDLWPAAIAGGHHLTGLLFHLANSALVVIVMTRLTGNLIASSVVAALWALHPTHVESVAWVAERKDVLSTFFWLLTMLAYARWVERPTKGRYVVTTVALVLGLMSKPMLVTLPFVLILLDYWPLRRMEITVPSLRARIVEKLPWFGLSFASSLVTFVVQQAGGAVRTLDTIPISERLANTVVAYVNYLGVTIWPQDLAMFYPSHEGGPPWWRVFGSTILFVGACIWIWRRRESCRSLFVGWLWFVGTLVPVIGIVQVGGQSMADRYTYVPHLGLFTALVFGIVKLTRLSPRTLAIGGAVVSLAFGALTYRQVQYWQNSYTLFEYTLSVTEDNAPIHYNLGTTFANDGDRANARLHLLAALRIKPDDLKARINLGHLDLLDEDLDAAEREYRFALKLDRRSVGANYGLGQVMIGRRQAPEAIEFLKVAVAEDPEHVDAQFKLGAMLAQQRQITEAREHLREAIRLNGGHHQEAELVLQRLATQKR
ncbi:MAG: tetratricopeptide repeat protein [Planctomycetes bacterium]|nr:tetratricopeptide repeat protein [Planctomycetota bacterium]